MTTEEYHKLLSEAAWHDEEARRLRKLAGETMPTVNDIRGHAEPLSYRVFKAKVVAGGAPTFAGKV